MQTAQSDEMLLDNLINTALTSTDLQLLVELASQCLQNPLVLISPSFRILTYSHELQPNDEIWKNAVSRGFITLEFGAALNNWEELKTLDGTSEYLTVTKISSIKRRFYKLTYQNEVLGYLNVTEGCTPFESHTPKTYALVTKIIAQQLAISHQVNDHATRMMDEELLLALVRNEFINRLHFKTIFDSTSLSKVKSFCMIVSDMHSHYTYNAGKDHFREQLKELLPGCVAVIHNMMIYILVPSDIKKAPQNKIIAYLKHLKTSIGISRSFEDLYEIQEPIYQATFALKHSKEPYIRNYDTCAVNDLLKHLPANMQHSIMPEIKALRYHDVSQGTQYLDTLTCFLTHHESIQDTASAMFTHRNTIHYRMKRMVEDFGIDPENPDLHASYLISCLLLQNIIQGSTDKTSNR